MLPSNRRGGQYCLATGGEVSVACKQQEGGQCCLATGGRAVLPSNRRGGQYIA